MFLKFVSPKVLKNAFLKGIDSFIELYNIQNNKNIVSSTLGNAAINLGKLKNFSKTSFVHTNEILASEITKANNLKAAIDRSNDNELKVIYKSFGTKLIDIHRRQTNEAFISSMYSFISLSIYYNASIYDANSEISLPINEYLLNFLIPNTRYKSGMYLLFEMVGNTLDTIESKEIYIQVTEATQINSEPLSETDKLWAVICHIAESEAKILLNENDFKKYKKIYDNNTPIVNNHSEIANNLLNNTQISIESTKTITELVAPIFNELTSLLSIVSNISQGINAYILKFTQNTENPGIGRQIASHATNEAQQFTTGLGWAYEPLQESIMGLMNKTPALIKLQTVIPPALIGQLLASISTTLVSAAFQSKSYGFINRHGITGQIRSFLLRNFIGMYSVHISNNYNYVVSSQIDRLTKEETGAKQITKIINDMKNHFKSFTEAYTKSIKQLPNKEKKGSLYFYLTMYADPDYQYSRNSKKIEEWNKVKLKNVIE